MGGAPGAAGAAGPGGATPSWARTIRRRTLSAAWGAGAGRAAVEAALAELPASGALALPASRGEVVEGTLLLWDTVLMPQLRLRAEGRRVDLPSPSEAEVQGIVDRVAADAGVGGPGGRLGREELEQVLMELVDFVLCAFYEKHKGEIQDYALGGALGTLAVFGVKRTWLMRHLPLGGLVSLVTPTLLVGPVVGVAGTWVAKGGELRQLRRVLGVERARRAVENLLRRLRKNL